MRKVFAALATLLTLAVVAQFFLAASGAFATAPNEESFQPHRMLGYGIVLFAVLMTVVAAISRMPGRVIGMTGLIAGLVLLQGVIRAIASAFGDTGESTTAGQFIFGLHAINALVIMALAGTIARRAREVSRSAATNLMTRTGDSQAAPTS
ncbi:MAG TPA: DUF6220 domain-containing protein [Jiangellaceae bacterium]